MCRLQYNCTASAVLPAFPSSCRVWMTPPSWGREGGALWCGPGPHRPRDPAGVSHVIWGMEPSTRVWTLKLKSQFSLIFLFHVQKCAGLFTINLRVMFLSRQLLAKAKVREAFLHPRFQLFLRESWGLYLARVSTTTIAVAGSAIAEDCCGEQGPHWGTAADQDSAT